MKYYSKNLEIITKYLIIIIGLIYQVEILNELRYALMFVATIQVLILIGTNIDEYRKMVFFAGGIFLILFILTAMISEFSKYSIIEGVNIFLLIFGLGNILDFEKNKKFYKQIIYAYIIFTFLMAIVDLSMYVVYFSGKYYFIDHYEYLGVHDSRLWGIFNANMTAVLVLISIILTWIGLIQKKYKKFLILNLILQIHVFILAQSRTTWLGVSVIIGIYILKYKPIKNIFVKIILAGLLCTSLYYFSNIYNKVLIKIPQTILFVSNEEGKPDEIAGLRKLNEDNKMQGRDYLWNVSYKLFREKPILGIGLYPVKEGTDKYFDKYWVSVVRQAGIHNMYLMILMVGGILGLISFLAYISILIWHVLKRFLFNNITKIEIILFGLLFAMFVQEVAESRIFYWLNYYSIICFLLIGYITKKYIKQHETKGV